MDYKYFCIDCEPRYYEDGEVNGISDISYDEQKIGMQPRMPLVYEIDSNGKKHWNWKIKIDISLGRIVDWPSGITANIHYKVCDQGTYWLEDNDGKEIHKIDSYVPKILDFYKDSYGDYIEMTVNENGCIKEWWYDEWIEDKINSFLEEEGF